MKPSFKCFWIGLAIYAASFCLVALENFKPLDFKVYGFAAAFVTFFGPLAAFKLALVNHTAPWKGYDLPGWVILCFPVCGATNPIFLAAAILSLTDSYPRTVKILKALVLLIIPVSGLLAFFVYRFYPREGFFLWVIGMLLVIFPKQAAWCLGYREDSVGTWPRLPHHTGAR